MSQRASSRTLLIGIGVSAAVALVVAACGGASRFATPTPFTLGGGSRIEGVTPTPTAGIPPTKAARTPAATSPASPPPGGGGTPAPGGAGGGGGADAGKQVFLTLGCTACHTIDGVPQARGTIGPNLTTVGTRAGSRVPGMAAEAYLRQSELDPGAFVVSGFPNVMPKLAEPGADLDNLVAFLLSLK